MVLLSPEMRSIESSRFALAQLSRLTGDRARDLEPSLRTEVKRALVQVDASPSWQRMLTEVVEMNFADKARALGDTLPLGLSLAEERLP